MAVEAEPRRPGRAGDWSLIVAGVLACGLPYALRAVGPSLRLVAPATPGATKARYERPVVPSSLVSSRSIRPVRTPSVASWPERPGKDEDARAVSVSFEPGGTSSTEGAPGLEKGLGAASGAAKSTTAAR